MRGLVPVILASIVPIIPQEAPAVSGDAYTEFSTATAPYSGSYKISTAQSLAALATAVNANYSMSGVTFYLVNSIDFNPGISIYSDGTYDGGTPTAWLPIGNVLSTPFKGTFRGNGFSISGIYISGSTDYCGLFGCTLAGAVDNLNVLNSYISGRYYIGGIIGYLYSSFGGLTASVTDCTFSGAVSGSQNCGGIAGYIYSDSSSASGSFKDVHGADIFERVAYDRADAGPIHKHIFNMITFIRHNESLPMARFG